MDLQKKIIFWTLGFGIITGLLFGLKDILLPFLAGMVLAYFLDPLADRLEENGLSRLMATCMILVVFSVIFISCLIVLIPVIGDQFSSFANSFPGYIKMLSKNIHEAGPQWLKDMLAQAEGKLSDSLSGFVSDGAGWLASLVKSIWSGGVAVVSIASLVIVTPIVAFYMLLDWDRMVAKIDEYVPLKHKDIVRSLALQIDQVMSGFIRGQGTVCLVLGTFYAVALSVLGLKYGLLIGLTAGLLSFIPYVGSGVGLLLSMSVALAQFWPDWPPIVGTAAIFLAGQFIEGNFLSPKLVGDKVGLHPVWLMFALFAFGYTFGFAGLLMAVPLAASIGVLLRYGLEKYRTSELYHGGSVALKKTRKRKTTRKTTPTKTAPVKSAAVKKTASVKSRKAVQKKPVHKKRVQKKSGVKKSK